MENSNATPQRFRPNPKARLMDQVREVLRYYHYAYTTEKSYCNWILRYIQFYGGQIHPEKMGAKEVEQFLSHLAVNGKVAASTQHQALNALIFLYKRVLDMPIDGKVAPVRSTRHRRVPTVLTREETQQLLSRMDGRHGFMAKLIYGGGLRLMECLRLRIQDVDFGQGLLFIRGAKGGKDRTTLLASRLHAETRVWMDQALDWHRRDLANGLGRVYVPEALARQYPGAASSPGWQWLFPSQKISTDPISGMSRRHHVNPSGLQKAVKRAALQAEIHKKVGCHTLRHSFATHMLENGVTIRNLQELLGHADVKTTEIYTHILKQDIRNLKSPYDLIS